MVGLEGAGCPAEEPKLDSVSMGPCRSFLSQRPGWFLEQVLRDKKPRQLPASHSLPHGACGSKSVAFKLSVWVSSVSNKKMRRNLSCH